MSAPSSLSDEFDLNSPNQTCVCQSARSPNLCGCLHCLHDTRRLLGEAQLMPVSVENQAEDPWQVKPQTGPLFLSALPGDAEGPRGAYFSKIVGSQIERLLDSRQGQPSQHRKPACIE